MKNIMCFGDSNTFGSNPLGGRHDIDVRWTGLLQKLLGSEYRIIEEGCGGRTTVYEDEIEPGRNGRPALYTLLSSHKPLDLVIIMLGTNDLKERFNVTADDLGKSMEQLIYLIKTYPFAPVYYEPKILIVSPILIGENIENSIFGSFSKRAYTMSKFFAKEYKIAADKYGCAFFDAATVSEPSEIDSLHMDEKGHLNLANSLAPIVRGILS